jgi:hypothetical protein
MNGLKCISIWIVLMLVIASISPCGAVQGFGANSVDKAGLSGNTTKVVPGPSPGQRDLRVVPAAVAIAGYVFTETELIVVLTAASGAVVAYATVSVNNHDYADVRDHWTDVSGRVKTLCNSMNDQASASVNYAHHQIASFLQQASQFSDLQAKYDAAKKAQDSYEDSKRKGIPVPGEGHNKETPGHSMDDDWKVPYSSQQLFHDNVDQQNGCPKQIRYYDGDGKPDLDIDFSHGDGKDI